MYKYLQLDANKIAFAYTETHSPLIGANFIAVANDDDLGKKWDGSKFVSVVN